MIRQLDKNEEAARFYERSLAHHPGGEFLESRMWFKIQLGSMKKTKKNSNQQLERTFLSGAAKNDTQLYRCVFLSPRGRVVQGNAFLIGLVRWESAPSADVRLDKIGNRPKWRKYA